MRDARGRFLPGCDPDRHTFTRAERRRGYRRLMAGGRNNDLSTRVLAWAWRKVRAYYRHQKARYQE